MRAPCVTARTIEPVLRRPLIVVLALLAPAALGACANDPYDRGSLERGLVDAGFEPAEAACVLERMEERFGEQRLSARIDATEREREVFAAIVSECRPPSTRSS
jgi:hypothetical protein